MTTRFSPALASVVISALACGSPALGAQISVSFSPQGPDPAGAATDLSQTTVPAGAAVGVVPLSNWNTVLTSGGNVNVSAGSIVDEFGAPTSLAITTSGMDFDGSDIDNPATNEARLLNGHIGTNDGPAVLSVTGVPFMPFGLIVYFSPSQADASTRIGTGRAIGPNIFYSLGGVHVGGRDAFIRTEATDNSVAISGANYVRYQVTIRLFFNVDLQDGGTGNAANKIYGFQIVDIPEPSAGLLAALGAVGLVRRRKRRSAR